MAVVGPNNAGFVGADGLGVWSFTDLNECLGDSDDAYAYYGQNVQLEDVLVQLYDSGLGLLGNDQSRNEAIAPPIPAEWRTWGGPADTWGATLTPEIVNASTFGLAFKWGTGPSDFFDDWSDEIRVIQFGLAVPTGATIDGIEVDFRIGPNSFGDEFPGVDAIRMTAYYTPAPAAGGNHSPSRMRLGLSLGI